MMSTDQPNQRAVLAIASLASRAIQITLAALLGVVVIAGAGLVQIEAVHNGAHDYRHSMGFPCH